MVCLYRVSHDMGSVGCLKDVREAISVARSVMEHTKETLLVGDDGRHFQIYCEYIASPIYMHCVSNKLCH